MIKVQTLAHQNRAAPQQLVNRAVTRRPSATHAAIPACTNRRIEPIEIRRERPGLTDASRSRLINSWTRLRLTQHRGTITKREQHSLHDHLPFGWSSVVAGRGLGLPDW